MKAKNFIFDLLFPPKCAVCRKILDLTYSGSDIERVMCSECGCQWEKAQDESCPVCLLPSSKCLCSPRKGLASGYEIPKLITYTTGTRNAQSRVIYSLKTVNDTRISDFLAGELVVSMTAYFKERGILPDSCIYTYVPRRAKAIAEHGFDQGDRLSRAVSKICEGKHESLFARHGGGEQKKLDSGERADNIKHSIYLKKRKVSNIKGKTIVVVDDLITTGATLGRAAQLLRHGGAKEVFLVCVGMTAEKIF